MVNTLSHLGIGLLIASVAGLNSRQIKIVAFMAILPDLDFILNAILILIDQSLSHHTYNTLYYLMGHREFMHSIIFASLITLYIWFKERDIPLTMASAAAIFSHIYLDYVTSWKMRPFFPLVMDSSTIGAIDFFDPVVTVISFIPIVYLLAEHAKKNGRLKKGNKWFLAFATGKYETFYRNLLILFTIWCMLNPLTKVLLIGHVEEIEGHSIDYQSSYPISPGRFLSAYSYNDTHYRIFTSSYWSGIEKGTFIHKYQGNEDQFMEYSTKAKTLYDASLPGEIDYPVYNVSASETNVTVTLSDARNLYAQYWAYFKTEYIFVFDNETGTYNVYIQRNVPYNKPVSMNHFE
ncbi:metal-dependent hydrolase [Methanolobus psychrotolerans]|uniref:metal-dependent hydrolase n=1 Tax=Methanolobus psychrotolerans TaxID=1874706 RepID=UPI000B918A43|nr:metal-dependent hydrolase [Methanolobus psychrotolerans]